MGYELLIPDYIEQNPDKLGAAHARLKRSGVPVWALIGHMPVHNGRADLVAADYEVPVEAVLAALAYYHQFEHEIEAELQSKRVPSV